MCGINGFVGNDDSLARAMNEVCPNRGPDDEGFYTDGTVTLAQRRLAIFDRTDKIGFVAPADSILRDPAVAKFARGIIFSDSFASRPYWNTRAVRRAFEDYVDGKKNIADEVWKWINTELWLRQHFQVSIED